MLHEGKVRGFIMEKKKIKIHWYFLLSAFFIFCLCFFIILTIKMNDINSKQQEFQKQIEELTDSILNKEPEQVVKEIYVNGDDSKNRELLLSEIERAKCHASGKAGGKQPLSGRKA